MPTTSIPTGLTAEERGFYEKLLTAVQTRKSKGVQAPHVMVITDLGKDYDDLAAILVLKELHRVGLIHLGGVITNMKPSRKRTILGRKILDLLGLQDVPIGVGTAGPVEYCEAFDHEFDASFMPDERTFTPNEDNFFEDGFELLHQVFTRAIREKRQVDLLLISPLGDVVKYANLQPNIFRKGVRKIYIQGGYSVSAEGILTPREDATNNFNDMTAAREFHELIRKENIPSVVYTRIAAFAARIPAKILSDLEASQHLIGSFLRHCHVKQDVTFYEVACSPKPFKDITQERFLRTRTNFFEKHPPGPLRSPNGTPLTLDGTPLPEGDQIKPYLVWTIVFDALAAFGIGGEDIATIFGVLDAESMANQTSIHKLVGTQKLQDDLSDIPNINPERMIFVLSALFKGALYEDTSRKKVTMQ